MIRVLTFVELIISTIWIARYPNYPSATAFLGFLIALIGQELNVNKKTDGLEKDRELFNDFLDVFPSNGKSAFFLKEHDIGAPFPGDHTQELERFRYMWNNAEHEFLNNELEEAKKKLWEDLDDFLKELSKKHIS
ncbi:hypothetical protein J2T55_000268 [Methylohalomonas lacus]|uniref:Uncharacterized protein n=1 Tax=Methylohalomonas lacus TaxID=398773 RepID=A0AAE3HJX5_9GAMM|nr:hypothetical protein [Methylohalomonas lacus]MCS3902272.1 hypothetical protein [Methylohalomonas lacus]